jgi:hypothetical protein
MIAMLSLAFMSNMDGQLNVARDQAANLHADLAAQAGLEYAQRQLLLDSTWNGTGLQQQVFADGPAFSVERHAMAADELFESDVHLSVKGLQSAAIAKFEAILRVTPGDPLLDKAFSILGDGEAENLQIGGDYLIVDEAGHLWQRNNGFGGQVYLGDDGKSFLDSDDEHDFDMFASDKRDDDNKHGRGRGRGRGRGHDDDKQTIHVVHDDMNVKGVWTHKQSRTPSILFHRIESSGKLHNYRVAKQPFASSQNQLQEDIHAPGWDLDIYLDGNPDYLVIENSELLAEQVIDKVVVIVLDEEETFVIKNCTLNKGLVVWAETDFDFQQDPRNSLVFNGHNTIGGDSNNLGILAPACEITTDGGNQQMVSGLSIVHSLNQVSRLVHNGVFIVLNSAQALYDSDFNYDRQVSLAPPQGIQFFGDLAAVNIEKIYESGDLALSY